MNETLMEDPQILSHFGAAVRRLRRGLDISQETLAERADLHRTYIADIERGARNVTLKSMTRLARALQVSTATLLLRSEEPSGRSELNGHSSAGKCVDILMVEDDRNDAELTLRAFKEARITNSVQVVQDGQEALNFLFCMGRFLDRKTDNRPQLVLLDLYLPKVNGMTVLRRIKSDQRTRSVPVVVLTASRDFRDLAECRRLGMESYIVKPVNFQGLTKATQRLNLDWTLLEPSPAKSLTTGKGVAPQAALG
jgi:CheY-like chemotaxis protein/DNA-binding XRE family transcriptional regulator